MSDDKKQRLKQLQSIIAAQNKAYAKGGGEENAKIGGEKKIVFMASEMLSLPPRKTFLVPDFDEIAGGDPIGKITIDYGPTSAGKTTWNYFKIAQYQRQGLICCVVNMENGFDPVWADRCGVLLDELVLVDAGTIFEETAKELWDLIKTRMIDHTLVDSIHGQQVKKEYYKSDGSNAKMKERGFEEDTVGGLPLKLGQFIKHITPVFGKSNMSMTIIGQARDKIDMFGGLTLTGGHAIKHAARRICLWNRAAKSTWPKEGSGQNAVLTGYRSRVRIELQQLNQHQNAEFSVPFHNDYGVDWKRLTIERAQEVGLMENVSGSWWQFPTRDGKMEKLNGDAALNKFFAEHPQELDFLLEKISANTKDTDGSDHKV